MTKRIYSLFVFFTLSLLLYAIAQASRFSYQGRLARIANLEARLAALEVLLLGDAQVAEAN